MLVSKMTVRCLFQKLLNWIFKLGNSASESLIGNVNLQKRTLIKRFKMG